LIENKSLEHDAWSMMHNKIIRGPIRLEFIIFNITTGMQKPFLPPQTTHPRQQGLRRWWSLSPP
jgi:hypothetical protein